MIIFNHLCMYIYTHIRIEIYRSSHRPWTGEMGFVVPGLDQSWPEAVLPDQQSSSPTPPASASGRRSLAAAGALRATIHCTLNMHGQTALKKKTKNPTRENRRPVNCIIPTRLRLTRLQNTLNRNRQAPQKQDKVKWKPSGTTWRRLRA